jgi:hypothetical protein
LGNPLNFPSGRAYNYHRPPMVTLLFTSVFVIAVLAIAIFFWQKAANKSETTELLPPPLRVGLFPDAEPADMQTATEDLKKSLLENAAKGETNAVQRAYELNDRSFYDDVLNVLIAQVDSPAKLLSLVSFVTTHDLPVTVALAQRSIDYWKGSLDRNSTTKMLHIAALSDDAATYCQAVEVALSAHREGKLQDLSAVELQSLINGEYWLLSSHTRSSGAGFVLKQTISTAKRELEVRTKTSTTSS